MRYRLGAVLNLSFKGCLGCVDVDFLWIMRKHVDGFLGVTPRG